MTIQYKIKSHNHCCLTLHPTVGIHARCRLKGVCLVKSLKSDCQALFFGSFAKSFFLHILFDILPANVIFNFQRGIVYAKNC